MKKLLSALFLVLFLGSAGVAFAQTTGSGKTATTGSGSIAVYKFNDLPGSPLTLDQIIGTSVAIFDLVLGVAAFLVLIYSGMMYIQSGGDTEKAAKARKSIMWALIGVLFASFSYFLVSLTIHFIQGDKMGNSTATSGSTLSGQVVTPIGGGNFVITGADGSSINQIEISRQTGGISYPVYIKLNHEPENDQVDVDIIREGALPININTASLSFNKSNWDQPQMVSVQYNGDGQIGQNAQLIVKSSVGDRYIIGINGPVMDVALPGEKDTTNGSVGSAGTDIGATGSCSAGDGGIGEAAGSCGTNSNIDTFPIY